MTILLDGGMGQELRARGLNSNAKVAGLALIDSPDVVREVHREYIDVGADVITTWNYAVTPHRLSQTGHRDMLEQMTRVAVEVANAARGKNSSVRIAGSLPPLRASYEPNAQNFSAMWKDYEEIASHLYEGVDLFICETMSSVSEAVAAASAAAVYKKPIWVSWTLRDECDGLLRSGETIIEAVRGLNDIPVDALLFNCCDATAITVALPQLRAATTYPIGAYANAFVPIKKDWKRQGLNFRDTKNFTPSEYANVIANWRTVGADIVGGCCGIGPAHIARLRELLDQ